MSSIKKVIKALLPDNRLGRSCRDWVKKRRIKIRVLQGNVKSTLDPVRVMLVGSGREREYLATMIFGDDCSVACDQSIWSWGLRPQVVWRKIDVLIFINPDELIKRSCKSSQVFHVPVWVRGEIDFETVAVLEKHQNIKSDLRRIIKHRLDYVVTTEPEAFDDYYYSMLVPSAKAAHGESAYIVDYDELKNKIDTSELLLVRKDGKVIAGEMLVYREGRAYAWSIGVKDGNYEHVKIGAMAACYIFTVRHLKEKDYQQVHLGSSKAFLMDGVLQYKKKWGLHLISARRGEFLIEPVRKSAGTLSLLANNPFIQLLDGEFTGEYFLTGSDEITAKKLQAIHKFCYFPGMKYLNIYSPGGEQGHDGVPENLRDTVRFRDIDALF